MTDKTFLSTGLLAALARRPALAPARAPRSLRLHQPESRDGDPRRLHLFPGRALGEREFERLQAYVDDRVAPLLAGLAPGVVEGLGAAFHGSGAGARVRVHPGLAVGAGGRLIRLFYPLDQAWTDLAAQAERDQDTTLRDGLFLLTVRSAVEAIDDVDPPEACVRTETSPLAQRRIETVSLLGLQRISGNPRLMAMPRARAANRIGVRLLAESPFRADSGAVPLGLVKVVDRLPVWFDPLAGRLLAEPDAAAHALLAHTIAALEDWQRAQDGPLPAVATRALGELLGLDHLPPAGPLPDGLLRDPAAPSPSLAFLPGDLQIELAPVPASTVEGVVADELGRGTVNLVHGLGERIRLLLAVDDIDYRADLFDLPQRDTRLEDELFVRAQAARSAYRAWTRQWEVLFHGLSDAQHKALRTPRLAGPPPDPGSYRDKLVADRAMALPPGDALPEPWASHRSAPHPSPLPLDRSLVAAPDGDGLLTRRERLRDDIRHLESALDQSFRLLEEVNDFLGLQRQQFDALTMSFSALAGGVAGDGLGAQLVRWTAKARFVPTADKTPE